MPTVVTVSSPNHGANRADTLGCVLHSTRGGAPSVEQEYIGTVSWFCNPAAGVSAHAVIAADGEVTLCVPAERVAWHAREYNGAWLGLELVQPRLGDPFTEAQYCSAGWWVEQMSTRFGFALSSAALPEHRAIPPGIRDGKSDIGPPFDVTRLIAYAERWRAQPSST